MSQCPYCFVQFKCVAQHLRLSVHCSAVHKEATLRRNLQQFRNVLPHGDDSEDSAEAKHPDSDHSYSFPLQDDEGDGMFSEDSVEIDELSDHVNRFVLPPDAIHHPKERTKGSYAVDSQMEGYIKLLCFLDQIQAPIKTFDELMQLLLELDCNKFKFGNVHPKRKSILNNVTKTFPIAPTECRKIELEQPIPKRGHSDDSEEAITATVYRFNVKHQIQDLLMDDIFFDVDNLVVNRNKPFSRYVPEDGMIDEIQSGQWYERTYDQMVDDPSKVIILPLKLYCDKTGLDPMMQRHALEPVMFSLTIISRDVQQNCEKAWRHLGFVPDLDKIVGVDKSTTSDPFHRGRNVRNYHLCMDYILEELIELQQTGMAVFLQIGDYVVKRHALFPVSIFVGDGKSADNLCCRIAHYNQPRMSRACYTSFEDCNNAEVKCQWVLRKDQEELQIRSLQDDAETDDELKEQLRDVSTYRCWSSMFRIDFGSNPHGQFLACTVDPMHMFEGGWIAMVCKAFVASLSGANIKKLNQWAIKHIKNNRSSFRKNFPRVDYSGGITKLTNIASHEWPGILLVYLLCARCPSGNAFLKRHFDDNDSKFAKKIRKHDENVTLNQKRQRTLMEKGLLKKGERLKAMQSGIQLVNQSSDEESTKESSIKMARCTINNFIEMCESLLCFHAFYKQKKYWKVGDQRAPKDFENALRAMMGQVISTMDRGDKTNNWNIQKFHEILHLPRQVVEYGNISNTDAGFGERGLKSWAKRPGRRALKGNVDVFTESTINRVREHVCLRKAAIIISEKETTQFSIADEQTTDSSTQDSDDSSGDDDSSDSSTGIKSSVSSKEFTEVRFTTRHKFIVSIDQCDETGERIVKSTTMSYVQTKSPLILPQHIIDLYKEEFFSNIENNNDPSDVGVSDDDDGNIHQRIPVYTEIILDNGDMIRCHPNFGDSGPIYDFAVVPRLLFAAPNKTPPSEEDTNKKRKTTTTDPNESHLSDLYPNHVPCRVISMFIDPNDGVAKAFVHGCQNRSQWNIDNDSVILESWSLQTQIQEYYVGNEGELHQDKEKYLRETTRRSRSDIVQLRHPLFQTIPVSAIRCGLWAVPDSDIFDDYDLKRPDAAHVMVVKDRNRYWAKSW